MRIARLRDGTAAVVFLRLGSWYLGPIEANLGYLADEDAAAAQVLQDYFVPGDASWQRAIQDTAVVLPALTALEALLGRSGDEGSPMSSLPLKECELGAPIVSASMRIFAAGANFADHAAAALRRLAGTDRSEQSFRDEREVEGLPPWGFTGVVDSVIGSGEEVRPPTTVRYLDYEAEIAVVLAVGGRDLRPDQVRFWAAAPWNDFSIRDPHLSVGPAIDRGVLMWTLQKNFHTGSAFGPWLTVEPALDVGDVHFELAVNGEIRQRSSTSRMIYPFVEIVSHLSHYIEMKPGDLITSGTPAGTAIEGGPEGPFLRDGDTVTIQADNLGTLANVVRLSESANA